MVVDDHAQYFGPRAPSRRRREAASGRCRCAGPSARRATPGRRPRAAPSRRRGWPGRRGAGSRRSRPGRHARAPRPDPARVVRRRCSPTGRWPAEPSPQIRRSRRPGRRRAAPAGRPRIRPRPSPTRSPRSRRSGGAGVARATAYAVRPGMPSAPRAADSGTPGGTDTGETAEPATTASVRQPVSASTCCPTSTSGQHDSTTSPTDRPGGTSPGLPSAPPQVGVERERADRDPHLARRASSERVDLDDVEVLRRGRTLGDPSKNDSGHGYLASAVGRRAAGRVGGIQSAARRTGDRSGGRAAQVAADRLATDDAVGHHPVAADERVGDLGGELGTLERACTPASTPSPRRARSR